MRKILFCLQFLFFLIHSAIIGMHKEFVCSKNPCVLRFGSQTELIVHLKNRHIFGVPDYCLKVDAKGKNYYECPQSNCPKKAYYKERFFARHIQAHGLLEGKIPVSYSGKYYRARRECLLNNQRERRAQVTSVKRAARIEQARENIQKSRYVACPVKTCSGALIDTSSLTLHVAQHIAQVEEPCPITPSLADAENPSSTLDIAHFFL